MTRLTLLVPDLFWPDRADSRPMAGLRLPALERVLGRGAHTPVSTGRWEWLLGAFGAEPAHPSGLAAASVRGLGSLPGEHGWLRADPVHLQARGTDLFLSRPAPGELTWHEAEGLLATLNAFFAPEGLRLEAPRPDAWLIRLPAPVALDTVPTPAAHGRSVAPLLPAGPQARVWRRRLNEAQMLLHEHPVNDAREQAGRLPINSLWIWGGAVEPRARAAPAARLLGGDDVLRGLALRAGMAVEDLPARWQGATQATWVQWEQAREAAQRGDVAGWQEALRRLDQDWLAPALAQLGSRKLHALQLAGFGARAGLVAALSSGAARHFWRRPMSLVAAASALPQ
jgi:hypothetical protein